MRIVRAQWPGTALELQAALDEFAGRKVEYAATVDVPAPTADPLIEMIHAAGGAFELEPEPEPEAMEPPPRDPLANAGKIARALIAKGVLTAEEIEGA